MKSKIQLERGVGIKNKNARDSSCAIMVRACCDPPPYNHTPGQQLSAAASSCLLAKMAGSRAWLSEATVCTKIPPYSRKGKQTSQENKQKGTEKSSTKKHSQPGKRGINSQSAYLTLKKEKRRAGDRDRTGEKDNESYGPKGGV